MRMNLVVKNEVSEYNKEAISNSRKKVSRNKIRFSNGTSLDFS